MYAVSPFFGSQIALCTGSSYTAAAMVGSTPLKFFMLGEYLGAERKGEDVSLLGGSTFDAETKQSCFVRCALTQQQPRERSARSERKAPRTRRERALSDAPAILHAALPHGVRGLRRDDDLVDPLHIARPDAACYRQRC